MDRIAAAARSLGALAPALAGLEELGDIPTDVARAEARGWFAPDEDERLRGWFARYLTARGALFETIADLAPLAEGHARARAREQLEAFLVAYAAACALVRAARFAVDTFAGQRVALRKLNEADPVHRIARKELTRIYRSLTSPRNAYRLLEAMSFADANRRELERVAAEGPLAEAWSLATVSESALRIGVERYARARLRYRWHSARRRGMSAVERAIFAVLEGGGRVVADLAAPRRQDRLSGAHRAAFVELLEPGDVLVLRHDRVASNLFLPGYWPHAALYLGTQETRERLSIEIDRERAARWAEPCRVLEARKDGVLFRALDDTLAVDAAAAIRPRLDDASLARAIARGLAHEGKAYNFDFDFSTSDRLVCTEVVYRAFHGVGGIEFTLRTRAGRPTLAAGDLLDLAVEGRGFETVAVFGTPQLGNRLVSGAAAHGALVRSYRAL